MKNFFFIIWCICDLPVFYLSFFLFKEMINNFCKQTILDFVYCLFAIVLVLKLQITIIIEYFKKDKDGIRK